MFKFGTGGWRDIIADGFTKENIMLLAQSLSEKMAKEGAKEIVIGFDRRFMSDLGATWLAEVFAANSITVYYIPSNAPTHTVKLTESTFDTTARFFKTRDDIPKMAVTILFMHPDATVLIDKDADQ